VFFTICTLGRYAIKKSFFILVLFFIALLINNRCDTNSTGATDEEAPYLKISVTDVPAVYDSVVIVFSEISANINSLWYHMRQEPVRVNLLEWTNGKTYTLTSGEVPSGQCTQIRFKIDEAYIGVNNQVHELSVPSGSTTGLKLGLDLTIKEGTKYNVVLDFDASQSVVVLGSENHPKGYQLKPQIRVIVDAEAGSISGTVLNPERLPWAHAITGDDTITSTKVDTASGYFKLAFLPENIYTVMVEDTSGKHYRQESVSVQVKQDNNLGEITLE
jgi:hypothetical protein